VVLRRRKQQEDGGKPHNEELQIAETRKNVISLFENAKIK
jgi:hypothetical protein